MSLYNYNWTGWQILKIQTEKETFYKVFMTYYRDEWRLNSGIVEFEDLTESDNIVLFIGQSGSEHACVADREGDVHWSWAHVLNEMLERPEITKISFEDFKKEFNA